MVATHRSFRHELDPIAAVKTFRGDLHGWPASGYADEVSTDVKDWNIHGYSHYLDNLIVHLRLFERLWPREAWASTSRWRDWHVSTRRGPTIGPTDIPASHWSCC